VFDGDAAALIDTLCGRPPDLVFHLTQGRHCSDVARLLDLLGVPYTGAGPTAIDLTTDKALTNDLLRANGLSVPPYLVATTGAPDLTELELPAVAKLRFGDGSYGVDDGCLLRDRGAVESKLRQLLEIYREPVILERFLPGREFSVSLLGNGDEVEVLPIREIDFSTLPPGTPPICTYDSKWTNSSVAYQRILSICPAPIPPALWDEVAAISRRVFRLVECRDYARIDFRLDGAGRPHVIDVNTNPDLEEEVGFEVAARSSGRSFDQTIADVMDAALARHASGRSAVAARC
jgi:D-alanine-D-alanine ligase